MVLSSALSAGIHTYVWLRLVRRTQLPRPWYIAATLAIALLFVSVPITISSRTYAPALSSTLAWVSMPWMALVGLAFVVLVAIDAARLVRWIARRARRAPEPE